MTDELTPEQEAAVRRLLAEARHDEPVPADVAARLDETLERLVADEGADDLEVFESSVAPGSASVTELTGVRRRRRNAGRLLLAAAAVVVGGVAVGQVVGNTSFPEAGSGDAADSSGSEVPRATADQPVEEEAEQDTAGGDTGADADGGSGGEAAPSAPSGNTLLQSVEAPLTLTSDNFAADVRRELRSTAALRQAAADADFDGLRAYASSDGAFVCAAGAYGEGAKLPAYYDAEEAVLVLRRPRGGIQRVDLLACGSADQLNSVELPAP